MISQNYKIKNTFVEKKYNNTDEKYDHCKERKVLMAKMRKNQPLNGF